ncbi:MAG: c-type cytochrome [Pseudomonadales bacterium]|nr:c-type cytochrome [Pseudomonadales bacterium]
MLKGFSFSGAGKKLVSCAILLLVGSGFVLASDDEILQRIQPAGSVCIEGQDCKAPTARKAVIASEAAPADEPASVEETAPAAEMEVAATGATGEETYKKSCAMCHAGGTAGAPKLGDGAAWAARSEKGLDGMLAIAKKGLNAMPPMGMCMSCSDDELKAAISYMADSGK